MVVETLRARGRADNGYCREITLRNIVGRRRRVELVRLMHVAAETGARFARDRTDAEPIEWLLSPQRHLDDRAAIDACTELEGFRRVVLFHGLALGPDTEPSHIAGIPAEDFISPAVQRCLAEVPPSNRPRIRAWPDGPRALYTSSICSELDGSNVQIYCAMIARSAGEVRARLRRRFGRLFEDQAKVMLGFDASEPLACALVSDAMADLLSFAAHDPTSELARGLDFQVEQRFEA